MNRSVAGSLVVSVMFACGTLGALAAEGVAFTIGNGSERIAVKAEAGDCARVTKVGEAVVLEVVNPKPNKWPAVYFNFDGYRNLDDVGEVHLRVRNLQEGSQMVGLKVKAITRQGEMPGTQRTLSGGRSRTVVLPLKLESYVFDKNPQLKGLKRHPKVGGGSSYTLAKTYSISVYLPPMSVGGKVIVESLELLPAVGKCETHVLKADELNPWVDEFGQAKFAEFPAKIHCAEDLRSQYRAELAELEAKPKAIPDVDEYGGWKGGPQLTATGHFRTEKVDGKWWLVDPAGHLYFAQGLNCGWDLTPTAVQYREEYFEKLPPKEGPTKQFWTEVKHVAYRNYYSDPSRVPYWAFSFQRHNLWQKYGNGYMASNTVMQAKRCHAWGINCLTGSPKDLREASKIPYHTGFGARSRPIVTAKGYWGELIDPFAPEFETNCMNSAKALLRVKDDPWCVGCTVNNELSWGANGISLAKSVLQAPDDQPAKVALLKLLAERGKTLETATDDDYRALGLAVSEKYYSTIRRVIKHYAPDMLYLGDRNDKRNPETFIAASRFCDVVTVNVYDFQASVELPAGAEDRPLWVTEFHFGCYDTGYFYASLIPVASQKVRADCYLAYLRSAIDSPNYVGANWFCWRDQPITGVIGESANSSCGVVSVTDVPYRELTGAMKTIAGEMYRRRYGASSVSAPVRTVESFNGGWSFAKDGGKDFVPVEVPHDWAIAGPFDPNGSGRTGKLPWQGTGVYRKTLVLKEKPAGRIFFDFDGVMARATLFVNGQPCGQGEYGYLGFRADATPYLMAGKNEIELRCDTRALFSRWYPGGGLYRNVRMVTTGDVYLEDDDLKIVTEDVLSDKAKLTVTGSISSRRAKDAKLDVTVTLKDADGRPVISDDERTDVVAFGEGEFDMSLEVAKPKLWTMKPGAYLYTVEVAITGEGVNDRLVRRIGFRDFRFDAKEGFVLNGERVQLNGVDLHSDLGPLGMAFDKDAMRRQLETMVDMGANALRTSHNPPAPEVLDLCDELGIFVWDECFDKWNATCARGDVPLEEFVPRQLEKLVRRDRNHPCVFAWSIGNEISPGKATPPGQEHWAGAVSLGTSLERCSRFRRVILALDTTRAVTIGSCFPEAGERGDYDLLDLTGWNYRGMYDKMKARCPDKPLVYSESASALSEYGYYAPTLPTNKTNFAKRVWRVDSYDYNAAAWSDIPDREFLRMERDRFCGGEFVWTGLDYLGEPTPYCYDKQAKNDSRSSYFGICDLCVLPKDRFYLYRSHWNKDAFTLHIVPDHWNFPEKAGKTMPVFVYTSADEAELFVNGQSMGRRRKDKSAGSLDDYYSILPRYRLMWMEVPYAAGEVKAVAYGKDGQVLGEKTLRTAGAPARVVLTPEKRYGELCVVRVTLADKDGNFVPNDSRRVSFAAEGCEIRAVGNSDPRGLDSFKDVKSHPLCFGRAAVYLRVKAGAKATLKASADGVAGASVEL